MCVCRAERKRGGSGLRGCRAGDPDAACLRHVVRDLFRERGWVHQLVAINGQPLPTVVSRYEGCEELLLDSSLHLYDDMTYAVHTTMREVCPNGTDLNLEGELGRYTRSGAATVSGDAITVALGGGRHTATFRR